ncbi:MAG TPA: TonB-dependent receptor [Lacunisphaera sp.]|nr:TonB-dependent receptor [Lacunisphaera sp.]
MRQFLARGLATGLLFTQSALLLPAQATPATTTSAPGDTIVLETFTVKAGFSGSLAAAAEAKKNNKSIVEVIMSEDIGKLPDISIADSLTRLTGVAAQRANGRAQNLSIRGLTGDFATTMLNGREQVSTNMNRSVEFDQYPAELLNQVIVYKTAGANLTGQGLAGTVDLITVHPLEKSGRTIALNAYYRTTELGALTPGVKKNGESYSIAYLDHSADGKFGYALGYAHTLTPFQGKQFQAWGYPTDTGNLYLGGTKSYVRSSNLKRNGYMGVFEYKPNDSIHSTVDIYYSKFQEKQLLRGMEIPLYWGQDVALQPGSTITGGLATKEVFTNVHPVLRNDSFVRDDKLMAAGWNLVIGENSAWPITFDMGYSKIERLDKNLEMWAGISFARTAPSDTVTVTLQPSTIPAFATTLDYTSTSLVKLTDPMGWGNSPIAGGAGPGYYKGFDAMDELGQFKLMTKHDLKKRPFSNMEVGVAYTDRFKRDGQKPSGWEYLTNGAQTASVPTPIGITDLSFLGVSKGVVAFDPFLPISNGTLSFYPNQDTGIIADRFNVRERILRPYAQFNIDSKWGSVPVTGNLGLQLNNVDQSSTGKSANGSTVTDVTAGSRYNDLAPSLNLNFLVTEQSYVRFSLARQIARPRMFDMKASRTWGYNPANAAQTSLLNSPWSGGGGNPSLKPWKADSVDLAFDKYFKDNKGYFSLALFHKKLLNYIYQSSSLQDFTGYPVISGPAPVLRQGTVTTPVNGNGGKIQGVEATLSLASEMISQSIRGFGVIMGAAYTDSTVEPWGPGHGTAAITGLSKKVANITLYYEYKGFSARVSEHYRSSYRAYTTNFGIPNPKGDVAPNGDFAETQPERIVDAQISYAIQSGEMKGLAFYAQAYNLNDEPLITYDNGDPRQVKNYQKYGASYSFGVAYKF